MPTRTRSRRRRATSIAAALALAMITPRGDASAGEPAAPADGVAPLEGSRARAPDAPATAGLDVTRPLLLLTPGAISYTPSRTSPLGLRYGLGAGMYFRTDSNLALSVGAHVEHVGVYRDSGPLSTLRLSSQLRLGGARARWFAYGLVEVSAVFTFDHSFQHELNSAESRIGPGALAGVGVMGLITRVFFLGAELGVNADLQLREGFDELAVASVQWRVVAGVLLGAR